MKTRRGMSDMIITGNPIAATKNEVSSLLDHEMSRRVLTNSLRDSKCSTETGELYPNK
jgi:hypothetical protein